MTTQDSPFTRRDFVKSSAVTAGALAASGVLPIARHAHGAQAGSDAIRAGLIGCGGRGTGAAFDAMRASDRVRIVALADAFDDRLQGSRTHLSQQGERATVPDERCYTGFNAYQDLLDEADVDMVILATPPHFRPIHFKAAVESGCHVFMEKPVAVDPTGVRMVIAAGEQADKKKLSVVAGTQRRHEKCYQEAMQRIHDGALGPIVAAQCYWNMGGLWMVEPKAEWSSMEWQLRNWLYFTWLSGDHIVEQHVHNLDVINWTLGSTPVKATGMGGRQVRTGENYGNIFDHFAVVYEYPNGVQVTSMCRQTDGAASRVEEVLIGANGQAITSSGRAHFQHLRDGAESWRFTGKNGNPYVDEHVDLIASIEGRIDRLNEAKQVAESTLTAIMGRMSAYTGQVVSWDQAMNSTLDLSPAEYAFTDVPVRPVAVPGKTPLV